MTVFSCFDKDKSVSEALILESVNPQYDERLFIEFQNKKKNQFLYTTFSELVIFGKFNEQSVVIALSHCRYKICDFWQSIF